MVNSLYEVRCEGTTSVAYTCHFQNKESGAKGLVNHLSLILSVIGGKYRGVIQWTLSKDTLNKGHLSNEDTVCSPNHIELCTNLPLN